MIWARHPAHLVLFMLCGQIGRSYLRRIGCSYFLSVGKHITELNDALVRTLERVVNFLPLSIHPGRIYMWRHFDVGGSISFIWHVINATGLLSLSGLLLKRLLTCQKALCHYSELKFTYLHGGGAKLILTIISGGDNLNIQIRLKFYFIAANSINGEARILSRHCGFHGRTTRAHGCITRTSVSNRWDTFVILSLLIG